MFLTFNQFLLEKKLQEASYIDSLNYGYSKDELMELIRKDNMKDSRDQSFAFYEDDVRGLMRAMGYDPNHFEYQEVGIFAYDEDEIYGISTYYEDPDVGANAPHPVIFISTSTPVMGLGPVLFKHTVEVTKKKYQDNYIVVHSVNNNSGNLLRRLGYKPVPDEDKRAIFKDKYYLRQVDLDSIFLISKPKK